MVYDIGFERAKREKPSFEERLAAIRTPEDIEALLADMEVEHRAAEAEIEARFQAKMADLRDRRVKSACDQAIRYSELFEQTGERRYAVEAARELRRAEAIRNEPLPSLLSAS